MFNNGNVIGSVRSKDLTAWARGLSPTSTTCSDVPCRWRARRPLASRVDPGIPEWPFVKFVHRRCLTSSRSVFLCVCAVFCAVPYLTECLEEASWHSEKAVIRSKQRNQSYSLTCVKESQKYVKTSRCVSPNHLISQQKISSRNGG